MLRDVIVRDFKGRAVHMMAVGASRGLVYVASLNSLDRIQRGLTEGVGVPREDVFEFDLDAWGRLNENPGDWGNVRPVDA